MKMGQMRNGAASTLSFLSLGLLTTTATAQNAIWRLGDLSPDTIAQATLLPDGGFLIPERRGLGWWEFPIFDPATGALKRTLPFSSHSGRPLSVSDDGTTFVQRSDLNGGHLVTVWKDGQEAPVFEFEEPEIQGEPTVSADGAYVMVSVGTAGSRKARWYSVVQGTFQGERTGSGVFVRGTNYLVYGALEGLGTRGIANLATGAEETTIRDKWTAGPFVPVAAQGSRALVLTAGTAGGGVIRTMNLTTGGLGSGADFETPLIAAAISSNAGQATLAFRDPATGRVNVETRNLANYSGTSILSAYARIDRLPRIAENGFIVPAWTGGGESDTLRSLYRIDSETGSKTRLPARETGGFAASHLYDGRIWQVDRTGRFLLVDLLHGQRRKTVESGYGRLDEVVTNPEGNEIGFRADGQPGFKIRELDLNEEHNVPGTGSLDEHALAIGSEGALLTRSPSPRRGRFFLNLYRFNGQVIRNYEEFEGGNDPIFDYGVGGTVAMGSDSDGGVLKVYQMYDGKTLRRIRLGERPTCLASAFGYLAVATPTRIRVFRTGDWATIYSRAATDTRALALTKDGRYLAVVAREGDLSGIYDVVRKGREMDLPDVEGLSHFDFFEGTKYLVGAGPISRAYPFLAIPRP